MKRYFLSWSGRPFLGELHTPDSTTFAQGVLDTQPKVMVRDLWRVHESHINLKNYKLLKFPKYF